MRYLAGRELYHHGKPILPGEPIGDAPDWPNLALLLRKGWIVMAPEVRRDPPAPLHPSGSIQSKRRGRRR